MSQLNLPPRKRSGAPDWEREAHHWPNSQYSEFHQIQRLIWHVQRVGTGPVALLIHGTGAATHSWSGLIPLLANRFEVIAIDLPGHGFTYTPPGFVPGLPQITKELLALLKALRVDPHLIIGHSAGAAIGITLTEILPEPPAAVVSINGALKPFEGIMGVIAPPVARIFSFGGVAAKALSFNAKDVRRVRRLLEDTGSSVDDQTLKNYHCLMKYPAHIQGTLQMMANWDLSDVERICSCLSVLTLFIVGDRDRAVSPGESRRMAEITPNSEYISLDDLGHLAQEESPEQINEILINHAL
ncbi:MAG: alpha/beta fold hydrolase BchO [Pseudomonadota bacterium]